MADVDRLTDDGKVTYTMDAPDDDDDKNDIHEGDVDLANNDQGVDANPADLMANLQVLRAGSTPSRSPTTTPSASTTENQRSMISKNCDVHYQVV